MYVAIDPYRKTTIIVYGIYFPKVSIKSIKNTRKNHCSIIRNESIVLSYYAINDLTNYKS